MLRPNGVDLSGIGIAMILDVPFSAPGMCVHDFIDLMIAGHASQGRGFVLLSVWGTAGAFSRSS